MKNNRALQREKRNPKSATFFRNFDYSLNYKRIDFRKTPEFYRVGKGEQGVLLVEPYKSEILKHWRFKNPAEAQKSAQAILELFCEYKKEHDFIGMDMARKFLQMGYTRARRYANHKSGRKYSSDGDVLPYENDPVKAESAKIFHEFWKKVNSDQTYASLKQAWKEAYG